MEQRDAAHVDGPAPARTEEDIASLVNRMDIDIHLTAGSDSGHASGVEDSASLHQQGRVVEASHEYVDMYEGDLPEQAVKAIRAATRMVNNKLAKVLAAMAAEETAVAAISIFYLDRDHKEEEDQKRFHEQRQGGIDGGAQVQGNFHFMEVDDDNDMYGTAMALTSGLAMVPANASSPLPCRTATVVVAGS
ncbi:unnamed protein product [Miscanthus lutarioriparius]|uniref:Uncharacterized protein n=1 Tax=Miscanthus lutarioriparius TaxID=422564 RepID=A0A811SNX8_9POAL|nr:unnamed protein product [Miscanthus lutarioriparius]